MKSLTNVVAFNEEKIFSHIYKYCEGSAINIPYEIMRSIKNRIIFTVTIHPYDKMIYSETYQKFKQKVDDIYWEERRLKKEGKK